ncbi:hypothetical protein [Solidesulfovibrio magneticus]|uniref:Uncharacterized protein n=1 Tax=Solidesulfovibrio magneticus (strain ATCC 700980 / DSM 13731 / RS-1) TaxID=573370 RepID=C4XJ11_SOLM1|nr:hypothetical protein [Solidesulfovibrio magneticus]BAH74175.1 hypothetical protein DMR_06840 [Solidesulfovibrio magneticus RS-1]
MAFQAPGHIFRTRAGQYPETGGSLLYVILAITLLAALSASVAKFYSSTLSTSLAGVQDIRAYYLALSGLNFWSAGKTGTYSLTGGTFTLAQSGPDAQGFYTVTSLGRTADNANCRLTAKRQSTKPITFDDDIKDFILPVFGKTANSKYAVLVFDKDMPDAQSGWSEAEWATLWTANANRYAGGWVRLGGNATDTNGAIWYGGDYGACSATPCQSGACRDGACTLGKGLRAFFRFTFSCYDGSVDSTSCADGYTFAVISAGNNAATASGGPASGSLGELLGYAGPGPSGTGIAPPKLAVEVDTYPNKGNGKETETGNRHDAGNENHVAVVYWGDDFGRNASYDDNAHGVGDNPTAGSTGYVAKAKAASGPNWLEDGEAHALRLELHRTGEGAASGTYRVKVWVDPKASGRDDVTADYAAESPLLDHTTTLAGRYNTGLDVIRFGWTEGTGGAVQTVAVYDFSLDFRR